MPADGREVGDPRREILFWGTWGASTTDQLTFASVAFGLLFIASLAPALRIARLNPADTLRDE